MANPMSFAFSDEFKERSEKLSKSVGKSKTQYIIEEVTTYAAGNLSDVKHFFLLLPCFLLILSFVFLSCDTSANETDTPSLKTVTFETNGGTDVLPINVKPGDKITKPEDDPVKSGYSFDKWYKDEQYDTAWDFDNDVVVGDVTLYAKWTYPFEVGILDAIPIGSASYILSWDNPTDDNFWGVIIKPYDRMHDNDNLFFVIENGVNPYEYIATGLYAPDLAIIIKTVDKEGIFSRGGVWYVRSPESPPSPR
jgi:uncharacterized repeat protein (TIGR02543 family)